MACRVMRRARTHDLRPARRTGRRIALCALVGAVAAASSVAQTTGPGQHERQFGSPPPLPAAEEPAVPQTPGQQPPADADRVRFTLRRVELAGGTVYAPAALAAMHAPLVGREISLADVFRLAEELTLRYRNDGYVLSRVIVPPQTIRDGVVQLQAVEGHVAQARIAGESAGPRATLERHLDAIRASRPLAASVLERELLLMNDLPGVSARAALAPSATPAASDLTIELSERRAGFGGGLNNRGSRSLGPWRIDLSGDLHQLLAGYDRLNARLIRTVPDDELTFATIGYERALGASGARAGIALSHVDAEPGGAQNVDLPTRSRSVTLSASVPWLRTRAQSLSVRAGLSVLDSETEIVSGGVVQPLSQDDISALRVGATWSRVDRFRGVSVVDVELSQGLKAFGASREGDANLSVAGGRPDFSKLALYAARLQSLAPQWSLLGALGAQYAAHTLLSPERFALGGEQFGRAYDTAELTGDSGVALKAELRYAGAGFAGLRDYTLYGYYEIGEVHRRGTSAATTGQAERESAANAGFGLRFSLPSVLTGYIELAQPLTRDVAQEGNDDARLFVGVQAAF